VGQAFPPARSELDWQPAWRPAAIQSYLKMKKIKTTRRVLGLAAILLLPVAADAAAGSLLATKPGSMGLPAGSQFPPHRVVDAVHDISAENSGVPETASLALFGLGLIGIALRKRR